MTTNADSSARNEAPRLLRDETEGERLDRDLTELLQELRVASVGVQVLFGFLLSLPFNARFGRLDHAQRGLFLADMLLAALAIVLLTGPVAYHRLTFRHNQKASLVRIANTLAIAGLSAVALAVTLAVALVVTLVEPGVGAGLITALIGMAFAALWFALPLAVLVRQRLHRGPAA